jgi:transcriptional regulator with XRE-family HTH domain
MTVREARSDNEWSQEQLAAKVGLTKQAISKIERGTGEPTVSTLSALSVALGYEYSFLIEEGFDIRGSADNKVLAAAIRQLAKLTPPNQSIALEQLRTLVRFQKPTKR